jgi:hypothetical protein
MEEEQSPAQLRGLQKVKSPIESVRQFCLIQLQVMKNKKLRLRKEIQNCEIQEEFLTQILLDLDTPSNIKKEDSS